MLNNLLYPKTMADGTVLPLGKGSILLIVLLLGGLLGLMIPPVKSPDESDHLRRAWMLSQGQWLLHTQPCDGETAFCQKNRSMSGGMVNRGLEIFLQGYNPNVRRKESGQDEQVKHVRWTEEAVFSHAPGTGYYFPLIYAPQAAGLVLGKNLDMSIARSYQWARGFVFVASVLVLLAAFAIFPPQSAVLAFLLLPMSLFQAVSTSIDFFSTALALLGLACYQRLEQGRGQASEALFGVMGVALFLVASSRAHLAPLLLLMFVAARFYRRPLPWLLSALALLTMLAWMAVSIPPVVDFRIARSATTGEVALFYLQFPARLWEVFRDTLLVPDFQDFYLRSFLGVFFDQSMSPGAYTTLLVLLGLIIGVSLAPFRSWRKEWLPRLALVLAAVGSVFLAFLAMLLTWSPHPASLIHGVQGRYMLVPAMLVTMAVVAWEPGGANSATIRRGLLVLFFGVAVLLSVHYLIRAFYL